MKAYPFKIPKKPNENIVVQEDREYTFFDKLHHHQEIQISYIVKGEGKLIVGNGIHNYKAGDIVAIDGHVPHLFQSKKSLTKSHMVSLFFSKNTFGEKFFELPEMQGLQTFFDNIKYGLHFNTENNSESLFIELLRAEKFQLFISLLEILTYISKSKTKLLNDQLYQKSLSNHQGTRLQVVFDYVMNNFQKEIKLNTAAEMIYMSPNSFCRFFKQHSNKSFFTFITEVRIAHACQLLLENKDLSISDIAIKSGFNTISNFNKHFKSIKGVNPSQYQKNMILT